MWLQSVIIFFIGTILFLFFLGSKWQNSETVNIRNNNECFCAQRKNPIGHQKTKPQMKMIIGLWFSDFLMCPEHYCDWSIQNWLVRLKAKYKPLYFLLSTVWYQNSFAFFKSFVFFLLWQYWYSSFLELIWYLCLGLLFYLTVEDEVQEHLEKAKADKVIEEVVRKTTA